MADRPGPLVRTEASNLVEVPKTKITNKPTCMNEAPNALRRAAALRTIKLLHTAIWLMFVLCVLAIPILGYLGRFQPAAWLVCLVLVEVLVLVFNRLRCPLTDVAARYTEDRRDNFDIYLPLWLARHNQSVFGILFVLGSLFALARWLARTG